LNYNNHIQNIESNFPNSDLLKESEFSDFNDEDFAKYCIDYCVNLTNNAADKLNCSLYFGVNYNKKINASAAINNNQAAITFNFGLIDKLGTIISDTITLFMKENIACFTINENQKEELKQISYNCCITYLFYHELAHIIQLLRINEKKSFNFQENYEEHKSYELRKHIYEFDADLFGSMLSGFELMKNVMNEKFEVNTDILFNSLTALLFTVANIVIEFSGNLFNKIYYKQNSHPHPFIRIIKIKEQVLEVISKNLRIDEVFYLTVLQRATKMISQILYTNSRTLNYEEFYNENSKGIESYIDEIEDKNIFYKELTRFKPQEFHNKFNI